jgi:hypothetical protein
MDSRLIMLKKTIERFPIMAFNNIEFRNALGNFATGVTALFTISLKVAGFG